MARPYWNAFDATERTNTNNAVWTDGVALTFTPNASKDYVVLWSCLSQNNNASEDVQIRLYEDSAAAERVLQSWEGKEVSTPIDYRSCGGMYKFTSSASPSSTTFQIQIKRESTAATVRGKNFSIVALELGANDQYAEALARTTNASNALATKATLTFTAPGVGDYLVIASCNFDNSTIADFQPIRLMLDGSTMLGTVPQSRDDPGVKDTANRCAWMRHATAASLSAASHSFTLQFARGSSGTAGCEQARILALRLDDFDAAYGIEDFSGTSGTQTSFQDAVTLTQTTQAAEHLVIATACIEGSTTTVSSSGQLTEDGASISGEQVSEPNAGGDMVPFFYAGIRDLTAASHSWRLQRKSETVVATTGINGAIAVLQVESPAAGIVGTATITEAADTASVDSTLAIAGAAGITEGGDALSAASALMIVGAGSIAEADDTLSAAGATAIGLMGEAAITEAGDTLSGASTLAIAGQAAMAEIDDALMAEGLVAGAPIIGGASITEGDDTLAAAGSYGAILAGGGGSSRRRRPIIVWKEEEVADEIEEAVVEAVVVLAERRRTVTPASVRKRVLRQPIIRQLRKHWDDPDLNALLDRAVLRILEQDEEDALTALLLA